MSLFKTVYFFCILVCFSISCKTQKLTEKEKAKIIETCNQHVKLYKECELDTLFDFNKLLIVTDSNLVSAIKKSNRFYSLMETEAFDFDYSVEGLIINDSIFGCKTKMENARKETWLDVEKINGIYKVSGLSGYKITKLDLARWDTALSKAPGIIKEKELIKQTVRNFFDKLNEKNYTELKKITSAECFELYWRRKRIDSIKGYNFRNNYEIREFDYVQIYGDSADCRTLVKGHGGTRMNLIKRDNKWIITGENGPNDYKGRIERLRQEEIDLLKEKEFIKILPIFDSAIRELIVNKNPSLLKDLTSPACYEFFNNFKSVCGKFNPRMLKIYGFRFERWGSKVKFSEDTAKMELLYLNYNFIKKNNKWKLHGIANSYQDELNLTLLVDEFENIKNSLNFSYSTYNLISNDKVEVMAIDESISSFPQEDTAIRNFLIDFDPPAKYNGIGGALYQFIKENNTKKKNISGQVLVSFVVEKDGSISTIKVIKGLNQTANSEAIRMISEMPKWTPALEFRKIVRSRYYLLIPF